MLLLSVQQSDNRSTCCLLLIKVSPCRVGSVLSVVKVKVKFTVLYLERTIGGAHLPIRTWKTTNVCDAWPVRRQTCGYLPSRKASPPIGWYQIILLGDRGTCVLTSCPGLHAIAERPEFELATYWSQVQRPNHSATEPHLLSEVVLLKSYCTPKFV